MPNFEYPTLEDWEDLADEAEVTPLAPAESASIPPSMPLDPDWEVLLQD